MGEVIKVKRNLMEALLSPSQVHSACQGIRAQGTLQDIGRGVPWSCLEFRVLGLGCALERRRSEGEESPLREVERRPLPPQLGDVGG